MKSLWVHFFLVFVCNWASGQDELRGLASLFESSKKSSQDFQGRIEVFEPSEDDALQFDFDSPSTNTLFKSRCVARGEDVLVEVIGTTAMGVVGPTSKYNDILEVLAKSRGVHYSFVTVGATSEPFANLMIYESRGGESLEHRIQASVFANINAFHQINGMDIDTVLGSIGSSLSFEKGIYRLAASSSKGGLKTVLQYVLDTTGNQQKATITLAFENDGAITLQTDMVVMGSMRGEKLAPEVIFRKQSGTLFGPADVEGVRIFYEPVEFKGFPISKEFFQKYERNYTVARDGATSTQELITAAPEIYMAEPARRFTDGGPSQGFSVGALRLILVCVSSLLIASLLVFMLKPVKRSK